MYTCRSLLLLYYTCRKWLNAEKTSMHNYMEDFSIFHFSCHCAKILKMLCIGLKIQIKRLQYKILKLQRKTSCVNVDVKKSAFLVTLVFTYAIKIQ